MRPVIDADLDWAWNALQWNRDLTRAVEAIRSAENKMTNHRAGVVNSVLAGIAADWQLGITQREVVSLHAAVDQITTCQLAGDCRNVSIRSDLDGGYGTERCPRGCIGDLHKLEAMLARRGYSSDAIDAILFGNWLPIFEAALPVA